MGERKRGVVGRKKKTSLDGHYKNHETRQEGREGRRVLECGSRAR